MKLNWKNTDSFLQKPDPAIKAVLVYGPDEGLVRERVQTLSKTVVDDLNDPFNVVELNGDQIKANPAALADETFAISMMGGRRLIRLRDIDDKIVTPLKEVLDDSDKIEHLIVIQGGDLPAKSAVRKLCESSKCAAALPCYVEDERDLSRFLSSFFTQQGRRIAPDALNIAASILTGDRALARAEAEKIIIYKGDDPSPISQEDIIACLGETNAETLDTLTQHMASGRAREMEDILAFLFSEGANAVMVLRVIQNYFRRLYITQGRMQDNMSAEQAMAKLYPPVFYKIKSSFQHHLRSWTPTRIEKALLMLNDTERQVKSGGIDPELVCRRTLLSLAVMAGQRR